MSINTEHERGEVKKVYAMSAYNPWGLFPRFIGWSIVLYIVVASVGSIVFGTERIGIYCVYMGLASLLSAWLNARVRIVVREYGLEYHDLFDDLFGKFRPHTFSAWENLSHLGLIDVGDYDSTLYACMLYLKHPAGKWLNIGKVFAGGSWYKGSIRPLIDIDELTHTSFGKDLLVYAPHVFEATGDRYKEGSLIG